VIAGISEVATDDLAVWQQNSTEEEVYQSLPAQSKRVVDRARAHRARLRDTKALVGLQRSLKSSEATKIGITVLREDDGCVASGIFWLPRLDGYVMDTPKSEFSARKCFLSFDPLRLDCAHNRFRAAFDDFTTSKEVDTTHTLPFLLLPQRLQYAFELVDAVQGGKVGNPLGVRLSGPNGVGKSATLLLAYLLCAARGLPAVYLPLSEPWVAAARHPGGGDAFLLEMFFTQNADLIICDSTLRIVFRAALLRLRDPFSSGVMTALQKCARGMNIAVITDEVQWITKEVEALRVPNPTPEMQTSGNYFATAWHDWANHNKHFHRMAAASAHAKRDQDLPDGDDNRLRIVEPLNELDRAALQAHPRSPAFIEVAEARSAVDFCAGGVLRKLVQCARRLPRNRKPTKEELRNMQDYMLYAMLEDCRAWLASVPPEHRKNAALTAMDLITGNFSWLTAPALYDSGIVYRCTTSEKVFPVSSLASAVILRALGEHSLSIARPLSSITDGVVRGLEFERQVNARLDGFVNPQGVPTKLLDGSPAPAVDLRCAFSLPFHKLTEVLPRSERVLYRPTSKTYGCDAILMPAEDDDKGIIYIIESSILHPTLFKRRNKVVNWFRPNGLLSQLVETHKRKAVVVLPYTETLDKKENLSAEVLSMSKGLVPSLESCAQADPSTSAAEGSTPSQRIDQAAEVGDAGKTVQGNSNKASGAGGKSTRQSKGALGEMRDKQKDTHTVEQQAEPKAAVGDVVRVVDQQPLIELGIVF
jgi:hypothetical protein